jgi:hypothetical protein
LSRCRSEVEIPGVPEDHRRLLETRGTTRRGTEEGSVLALLLWILAVVLVVSGIVSLVRGEVLWGIVLIVVGLLIGPGGVSIFT